MMDPRDRTIVERIRQAACEIRAIRAKAQADRDRANTPAPVVVPDDTNGPTAG